MLPRNNFEILDPRTAGNALKLSILPSPRYFVSFKILYDPIGQTFLAPGGYVRIPRIPTPPLTYGPQKYLCFVNKRLNHKPNLYYY